MNVAVLSGRLTKDCELRYTSSNIPVASFTLAVQGYKKDDVDFIDCVVWKASAENLAKYTSKGSQIELKGRISKRSYDASDGSKRYITEVVADNVRFLDPKPKNDEHVQPSATNDMKQPDPFFAKSNIDIDTENLPF